MPDVRVELCGISTTIACADGDEPQLEQLVAMLTERVGHARAIVGSSDHWRQLLFAAIFLADELRSLQSQQAEVDGQTRQDAARITALAHRIAAGAVRLEQLVASDRDGA